MRHATRMLLLPEDVYNELMLKSAAAVSEPGGGEQFVPPTAATSDAQLMGLSKRRMEKISRQDAGDGRELKYSQEFKRFRKLAKDNEQRPVNVRMAAVPPNAPIEGTQPTKKEESTTTTSTNRRRRRR
jgi:hypothetical protein